ncbi:hypothetical protein D9M72_491410 [compost metagenome]
MIADELAVIGGLQTILAAEILDGAFSLGDIVAQFVEPCIEVLGNTAGALGGRLKQFLLKGRDDRVGQCHRL